MAILRGDDKKRLIEHLGSEAVMVAEKANKIIIGELSYHHPNFQICFNGRRRNINKRDTVAIPDLEDFSKYRGSYDLVIY